MVNWAHELEALGIPADRVKLVERNAELSGKLRARGATIVSVGEALHTIFQHLDPFVECQDTVCAELLRILRQTQP